MADPIKLSAPEQAESEAPKLTPAQQRIDAIVRDWVYGHIHNGPIARTTECFESLIAALPALRDAILSGGRNGGS